MVCSGAVRTKHLLLQLLVPLLDLLRQPLMETHTGGDIQVETHTHVNTQVEGERERESGQLCKSVFCPFHASSMLTPDLRRG